jgi:chaperonin GroES
MEMLRDLLLVKPLIADEISEGGLYIPESARTRNSIAGVVSSGKNSKAQPGDTIIHIKEAGQEIIIGGEPHYIIRDCDILAYLTNGN